MNGPYFEIVQRIERFLDSQGCCGLGQLGWGWEGVVILTSRQSAIKGFKFSEHYRRERDVYCRLREHRITKVQGFAVPRLLQFDDELEVIEMTIVAPPFALDFAGARLDRPSDFPPDVMEEWEREKEEQFEEDWPLVKSVIAEFERYGIFLGDLHPGNIRVRPER